MSREKNTISYGYEVKVPILKNINVSFEKKELVFAIGKTGSGRKTFVDILCGQDGKVREGIERKNIEKRRGLG